MISRIFVYIHRNDFGCFSEYATNYSCLSACLCAFISHHSHLHFFFVSFYSYLFPQIPLPVSFLWGSPLLQSVCYLPGESGGGDCDDLCTRGGRGGCCCLEELDTRTLKVQSASWSSNRQPCTVLQKVKRIYLGLGAHRAWLWMIMTIS